MRVLEKLTQNLGWRALRVLGPATSARYILALVRNLPEVLRSGDLRAVDRSMGSRPVTVYLNGTRFVLDCPYVDEQIKDATFTFGIVREILIRNCYLRDGVSKCAKTAHTVLDLGANRGVFSVMMACHAELVISVECQPVFQKVIAHSMGLNGFTNYRIETAFVGGGGACDNTQRRRVTVPELLQKHGLESVDLIKIDIEGSEFSLFQSPEWLDLVSAICMEVHPQFGDVGGICHALSRCGFSVVARDRYFRAVEDPQRADFVYAWRQHIASRGPRL